MQVLNVLDASGVPMEMGMGMRGDDRIVTIRIVPFMHGCGLELQRI